MVTVPGIRLEYAVPGIRQIYAALIASPLIVLWTGRKPTKRTYETLQLYFVGWVSPVGSTTSSGRRGEEELDEHLAELKKV